MKDVNTNSKKYWNEYVEYWEQKVSDANNNAHAIDKTSADALAARQISKLNIKKEDKFLDYGCGSGRLYPYYLEISGGGGAEIIMGQIFRQ